jgi:hypothetical protein
MLLKHGIEEYGYIFEVYKTGRNRVVSSHQGLHVQRFATLVRGDVIYNDD